MTVQTREVICTHKDGMLESSLLPSLQPVQLAEEWGDVVEFRRRKDELSSGVHH